MPTQDLFIPQTVNLDLIGGVSFTKGCYPGQEVVARSHYRGTVKRRMAYGIVPGQAAATIMAGSDVYHAATPNEPCGRVIDAAGAPDASILFETTLSTLSSGDLRLGSVDGPVIQSRPLQYETVQALPNASASSRDR
jgi:folate-binding protein YgfZ